MEVKKRRGLISGVAGREEAVGWQAGTLVLFPGGALASRTGGHGCSQVDVSMRYRRVQPLVFPLA